MSEEEDLALLMEKRMAAIAAKKQQTQANEEAYISTLKKESEQKTIILPIKATNPKRENRKSPKITKPETASTDTLVSPDQLTDLITKIVTQKLEEFKQTLPVPLPVSTPPPISTLVPHTIISKKTVIRYIKANATKGLQTWLVKQNRVNDLNFLAIMVNELAFGVVEGMLPVPQTDGDIDNEWDPAAEEGWVESSPSPKKPSKKVKHDAKI